MNNNDTPDIWKNNAQLCKKLRKLNEKAELSFWLSLLITAIWALFLSEHSYTSAAVLWWMWATGALINVLVDVQRNKILDIISKR